jgi:hypothetical protein
MDTLVYLGSSAFWSVVGFLVGYLIGRVEREVEREVKDLVTHDENDESTAAGDDDDNPERT